MNVSKLIILPGATNVLGGTLVTLSLFIKGCQILGRDDSILVLTRSGSYSEKYLEEAGQGIYLQKIDANDDTQFVKKALQWVKQQPLDYPLLLDNCVAKQLMSVLVPASPILGLSKRPIYFFFHDLAISYNRVGYWIRKFIFSTMSPIALCNSQFTAAQVSRYLGNVKGIFYQPVDPEKYNDLPLIGSPPKELQSILNSGSKLILTPSRLNKPGIVNDKNLRALIPVLAELNRFGGDYHVAIVGEDTSVDGSHTRDLLEAVEKAKVADSFTILPPTLAIENYYKCADVVVTLAPREPFGRTVVEAIACGTPVVGSSSGGIGEILSNFAPEWKVDPQDAIATAKTIMRVVSDRNTPTLLQAGKEWVKRECSLTKYARGILEEGLGVRG
jgi:glycosyltransferase involved in cell wall biosynthesis